MERNAHYALVGLVSLLLFLGLIIFVVWLARLQFANQYTVYDVDFKGPVRGLSAGGEVYFNGIKVGQVTKLSLDKQDPNRVVARIRTSADAPVRADSAAALEPMGITGVNYVQITAGTTSKPLLRDVTPSNQIPVIRAQQSQIEGLLEGGGDVLARTVEALDRVNKLLSDNNITTMSQTLTNLRADTALIGDQKVLLSDLDTTVKSFSATAQRIDRLSDSANQLINTDGRQTLANLSATADNLKGVAQQARTLLGGVQGPTTEFASTSLPQLSRTIVTLQSAAEDLDRVVNEVEQNPRALLTKAPAKQIQVKP